MIVKDLSPYQIEDPPDVVEFINMMKSDTGKMWLRAGGKTFMASAMILDKVTWRRRKMSVFGRKWRKRIGKK